MTQHEHEMISKGAAVTGQSAALPEPIESQTHFSGADSNFRKGFGKEKLRKQRERRKVESEMKGKTLLKNQLIAVIACRYVPKTQRISLVLLRLIFVHRHSFLTTASHFH